MSDGLMERLSSKLGNVMHNAVLESSKRNTQREFRTILFSAPRVVASLRRLRSAANSRPISLISRCSFINCSPRTTGSCGPSVSTWERSG